MSTYLFNPSRNMRRKLAMLNAIMLIVLLMLPVFGLVVKADAANDVSISDFMYYNLGNTKASGPQIRLPSYDQLTASSGAPSGIDANARQACNLTVHSMFSRDGYNRWVSSIDQYVNYDNGNLSARATTGTTPTDNDYSEFNSVSNKFADNWGYYEAKVYTDGIYGQDPNPHAGFLSLILSGAGDFMSIVYYLLCRVAMWLSVALVGLDVIFLVASPLRPFLAPNQNGARFVPQMAGGAGGMPGAQRSHGMRMNWVSQSAIHAVYGSGSMGGMGAGQMGDHSGKSGVRIILDYLKDSLPLLALSFTYLVLVAGKLWPSLIAAIAGAMSVVLRTLGI